MTYKIPVRLDGITEDIDTSPADSDENFFTGVKRKRTARYYLSGINPKSTRSGILAYLEKVNVHVTYLRLFNPKHSAQRLSAKLNVVENCADSIESHNFWPDGVQCRKWLSGKIKHAGPDYTFITKKTMIDYFLVNRSVLGQLRSCEILDEGSISSTSDHLPIIVELLIDNNPHRIMNSFGKFPAWHKIDDKHIRNYQEFIDVPLELLTDRIISDNVEVNTVNTEIESILHAAADSVIPTCGFNPYTKPYWTPDVKKAHQTERSMRKRWLADGRPRGMSHESYKHYKKAKYEFRNVQHAAYEQYIQKCYDDINEAAECDIRLFWKLIKRYKPSTSRIYPEIIHNGDTCNNPESIANAFMDYFSNLCTMDNTDTFDTSKKLFIDSAYSEILKTCCNSNENLPGGVINECEVRDIVKSLMRKKASGHDKIQNEHLIYGGEVVIPLKIFTREHDSVKEVPIKVYLKT
ncbi:unnamed protein product [Mytilus coruscus]|uniref:Endonuclease/exonuclease/phosphatase domain-containing protein n=1 Tax=Mytilus coruscus TaxID=42192 RepID=A0A6J8D9P6_MYTCO|nr:unnamed protein product [Mytilus coruscus]